MAAIDKMMNIKCIERYAGYGITVRCKNEKCLTYHKFKNSDICLICESVCKGHRTCKTFYFGPDDINNSKVNSEIENYQCKNCGSKEFLTPLQ